MNWIKLTAILILLMTITVHGDRNELDENRPVRIDPILRKALLKALSTLEKESEEERLRLAALKVPTETSKTIDEILEESTPADSGLVQFHSFVAQTRNSTNNNGDVITTVVVSAPDPRLRPPTENNNLSEGDDNNDDIVFNFNKLDPIRNSDIKIENVQLARSVTTSIKANEIETITKAIDGLRSTADVISIVSTTPAARVSTTTGIPTTTTPQPIKNEDGENIEKVKKNDVHIFQAPLVAAFTVQQDELGMPRNVIPLFKSPTEPTTVLSQRNQIPPSPPTAATFVQPTSNVDDQPNKQQSVPQQQSQQPIQSIIQQSQNIANQQFPFPFFLEQRQRDLEQQILFLQSQNRQQEALLRQQNFYQEQFNLYRQQQFALEQRQRLEEEQRLRLQRIEQERFSRFNAQQAFQQNNFIPSQPLVQLPLPTANVQFLPSITLPTVSSVPTEQQLPIRESINFNLNPSSSQFTKPTTSKPPVAPLLSPSQQLPLKSFQTFINPNSNNIVPLPENIPQNLSLNRNRVFRHESQTGNFGINQKSNQFNYNYNNNFNNGFRPFAPVHLNSQLQSLLYQSGISSVGRSPEDIDIISKVLSLNHGVQQSNNNFLDDHRRFVRQAYIY